MHRPTATLLLAALLGLSAACVGGPNDRCYIDDLRYHEARRAFERTQSLEVVERALKDAHWPNCEINEAIYRIEKEFGINDELPSPVRIRSEQEIMAEEQMEKELLRGKAGGAFSLGTQ